MVVVGHPHFLQAEVDRLPLADGRRLTVNTVANITDAKFAAGTIDCYSPVEVDLAQVVQGEVCAEAGRVAVEWCKAAAQAALRGEVAAMVTAPLNKEAFNRAGFHFAGHTELLATETGAPSSRLALMSDTLNVIHVTGHVSTADIEKKMTAERIDQTVEMLHSFYVRRGQPNIRIALAAFNPHGSDGGLFGDHEARLLVPAVERARAKGVNLVGPVPADTVFLKGYRKQYDFVIALYHDQGHIPMKMVGFDTAVNVTFGLPIIRTSVDHGTAFDIAGRGIADPNNLRQAAIMACTLAQ